MADDTLVDTFNEAVNLVYEQNQVPLFRATVEGVKDAFIANFKKAPDEDTQKELVTALTFFIVQQANTVPTKAGYSLAIGDTVETLCTALAETVADRSLIPDDFALCLLKGAQAINEQWGGKQYEEAKHQTVEKIIAAAEKFPPKSLVRPAGYQPPTPPPGQKPAPPAPAKPAQPDFRSLLKKI